MVILLTTHLPFYPYVIYEQPLSKNLNWYQTVKRIMSRQINVKSHFKGISFSNNLGYLCFANATVNFLCVSRNICVKIRQNHCVACDYLLSKRNDFSLEQSSLLLKDWVSYNHPQFNNTKQQCPGIVLLNFIWFRNISWVNASGLKFLHQDSTRLNGFSPKGNLMLFDLSELIG